MAYGEIEGFLSEAIGLDVASLGAGTVERAVRTRMAARGDTHLGAYTAELRRSPAEQQALSEMVRIPETWFFRDPAVFEALRSWTLERWLPGNPSGPLRVLSVGCSTGEEPYSIVMALVDGVLQADRVRVRGVDLSVQALAVAERGEFGAYAFRARDLTFRERHFRQVGPTRWELDPRLRSRVEFQHANIADPGFMTDGSLFDVIFCRNVLIYFDADARNRVLSRLRDSLDAVGLLFVGAAEAFWLRGSGFTSAGMDRANAFRRAEAAPRRASIGCRSFRAPALSGRAVSPPPPAPRSPLAGPQPTLEPPAASLDLARALADAGRLEEAAAAVEGFLSTAPPSGEAFYLLGMVRDALGEAERAEVCYRKSLYLDPERAEAAVHLAALLERGGDAAAAARLPERARVIASRAEAGARAARAAGEG